MSQLKEIQVSLDRAERELREFGHFLHENEYFGEGAVVKELRKRPDLICLIANMAPHIIIGDRYKFEFGIAGVFWADLVVGSSQSKWFVFVEFEDGSKNSLFGSVGTHQMRNWSRRFEHGFGQMIDWASALDDVGNSQLFKNYLGFDDFNAMYLLVCGRDSTMSEAEKRRLSWRATNCFLGREHRQLATCLTYDGLFRQLQSTIEGLRLSLVSLDSAAR
jgi:hypothetical protein